MPGGDAPARSCSHAFCQGQSVGRCRVSLRAERASRPGMLMSCARIVPVVALAWNVEARTPAVLVRLNAIAAQTSQALLAQNFPDVILSRVVDRGRDLGVCVVDGVREAG